MTTGRAVVRLQLLTARTNVWVAILGVVSAVAGLLALYLGWDNGTLSNSLDEANVRNGKLNQANNQLRGELDQANRVLDERLDEIDKLKLEKAELERALPPSVTSAESAARVRKAATLDIATNGDRIDLNSTLANFKQTGYGDDDTLSYDRGTLRAYGVSAVTLTEGTASYGVCSTTSGWARTDRIEANSLRTSNVCLRLKSGRYASIVANDYNEDKVNLSITIWE